MTAESSVEAGHRIRLGMVGGGHGAFIGAVHRFAARLDGCKYAPQENPAS